MRGAAALALIALFLAPEDAAAQTAGSPNGGAGRGGGVADVPGGEGTIRGRVLHPSEPAKTAGLDVALYALLPDGTPGLRDTQTDDSGRFEFSKVSSDPNVVYLIGARFGAVPFGERVTFEAGESLAEVQIAVSEPIRDPSRVRVLESELILDWLGGRLIGSTRHRLRNDSGAVVHVPEGARSGGTPTFVAELPPTAVDFVPAPGTFSTGVVREDAKLTFWGPLYPGEQQLGYQFALPLDGETEGAEIPLRFPLPAGAGRFQILLAEGGPEFESSALEEAEVVEREGRRYRVWRAATVAPGSTVEGTIRLPASSRDLSAVRITRADVWVETDDTVTQVTQEQRFQVGGGRILMAPEGELIASFPLPPGAELLGTSANSAALGLARAANGDLELAGPLPPGDTVFGFRYRVAAGGPQPHDTLILRFSRPVVALNVLVADTGILATDDRLHRLRPVRSGTRTYLRREGFQIDPGETVEVKFERLDREPPPRNAALISMLSLLAVGLLFALRPLQPGPSDASEEAPEADRFQLERENVYEAIRDLDHDFETGKVDAEDHERMRGELRGRAAALIQAQRDRDAAPAAPAAESAAAEIAETPTSPASEARFCPECGQPLTEAWKFCAGCGADLRSLREGGPAA